MIESSATEASGLVLPRRLKHLLAAVIVGSYAMFGGGIAFAIHVNNDRVVAESDARAEALAEEAQKRTDGDRRILIARTVVTCEERNDTKEALRATINAAIEGGGGVGDLTAVPGFGDLDLTTQIYLKNLTVLAADTPGAAERLAAYRDSLIDEDCEQVGAQFEAELQASDEASLEARE